jgi:tetratricopeptide (TPR) repeat protein
MSTGRLATLVVCSAFAVITAAPAPSRALPPPPETTDPIRDADGGAALKQAAELSRRAVRLIGEGKWDLVETTLEEALRLVPDDPVNLYNLACAKARLGRAEAAADYLERAAAAGFADFGLFERDPDLAAVRSLPRYKKFIADKDRWERKAADRLLAGLKAHFGEDKGYLYEIDEENKLIFAAHLEPAAMDELRRSLAAQARGQRRDLFAHAPQAYVRVVIPTQADYRKIMRLRGVGGAYHVASKTLVAERPGEVIRHEFTHALHHADRAVAGQEHAPWVVEGLGVLYESAATDAEGALVPDDRNRRLEIARAAARRRSLVPLARLVKMSPEELLRRPNITYAETGALMLYLLERGALRTFYERYKESFVDDPTGEKALLTSTGKKTLAGVEAAWSQWLIDAPPPPPAPTQETRVLGHAAFLGLALEPAEGGLAVTGLVEGGPAAVAGVEAGDLLVAINNKPLPDYASLRPAIGAYAPGKAITLRVLRGEDYLDLPVELPAPPRAARPPE